MHNNTEKIADGFKGEKAIVTPYNIRHMQAANPITRQLYVTHIGYYPNARHHYRERPEGSNENIFIYCEEGKGWITHEGRQHSLSKNEAFIIPAHEAHAYGTDNNDPWSIYWLHFCGDNAAMFAPAAGRIIYIGDSDKSRHRDRFMLFEEMYQNLEMGYSPENLEYVTICLIHFLGSVKYIDQYREVKKAKESDVVQKSIVFMKDNLENRITLKDLALHAGYSASHFGNLFYRKTSYAPMVYYNQLKMQRACSYLQFSGLKIKEIAFRLGYYDPFHFSKAFRREMGITPREYRKRYTHTEHK